MKEETASTEFAPADRSQESEIKRQTRLFGNLPYFKRFIDFVPDVIVVLNENRQIVFANNTALLFLKAEDLSDLSGLRPGEALNCEHAYASKGGCGTTVFCRYCGAALNRLLRLSFALVKNKTFYRSPHLVQVSS